MYNQVWDLGLNIVYSPMFLECYLQLKNTSYAPLCKMDINLHGKKLRVYIFHTCIYWVHRSIQRVVVPLNITGRMICVKESHVQVTRVAYATKKPWFWSKLGKSLLNKSVYVNSLQNTCCAWGVFRRRFPV